MKNKALLWFDYFRNVKIRNLFGHKVIAAHNKADIKIMGLMRVRNESLILQDTLDHMAQHVDAIIMFDDSSTDDSVQIALNHPVVLEVILNKKWRKNRTWEETANRRKLLQQGKKYNPDWFFYFDADERYEGNIKEYLAGDIKATGIRISLFDAYITKQDKESYKSGELFNFRNKFGIEKRDILMIWKNLPNVDYYLPDSREPQGITNTETNFYCQHYGKSLSIKHWEETCDYYVDNFPQYSEKWKLRKGKAVHEISDFGTKLYTWDEVKKHAKPM